MKVLDVLTQIRSLMHTPTQLPVMLVVGDMADWQKMGRKAPHVDGCKWTDFDRLDADVLEESAPNVVISPLISPSFDVLELACRLEALSYKGRLRALAVDLPNPSMVCREVHASAPSIDFDLFILCDQQVAMLPKPKRR